MIQMLISKEPFNTLRKKKVGMQLHGPMHSSLSQHLHSPFGELQRGAPRETNECDLSMH
jgi:hypothetical protein